jgi:hypothetical protein
VSSWLVRCYPARWRVRYEDEFEAVLEERALGPLDVADILLGAIDAQLRQRGHPTRIAHGRGSIMSLRVGGLAAILGAALWGAAGLTNSGVVPDLVPGTPSAFLVAGVPAMLLALSGLSMFQVRTDPRQSWVAFAVPAAGATSFLVGVAGAAMGGGELFWLLFGLGALTAIAGSGVFAIATFRTGILSRFGVALIGLACPLILFTISNQGLQTIAAGGLAMFACGWFGLGVQALRLDRRSAAPRWA